MNNIVIKQRLIVWYALIGCIFSLLAIRLGWVQLVKGQFFVTAADDNRFFSLSIPAPRGLILDRFGEAMVWNERSYALLSDSTTLYSQSTPITRDEALSQLATNSAQVSTHYERQVAMPEAIASVVGYVGDVTAEELQRNSDLALADQIGKSGLERLFNQQLQGIAGKDVYEINALGLRQRILEHVAPQLGREVKTTIDPFLSQIAFEALGEKKGTVLILDATTGEVLTLVNSPSYNAQVMNSHPISEQERLARQQQLQTWFSDPDQPFFNRATSGAYPPGSVFKMVTALAGLESKAIDTSTEVVDEGVLKVGDYAYGNWYFRQYGRTEGAISLERAIARSNDIYFYKAAEWVGPAALAKMAQALGFGQRTGIGLGTEQSGLVPDPVWKEQTLKEPWYLGNTYHFGIGQGDLLVTPIQIAQYVQALANQGTMCTPHVTSSEQSICHEVGMSDESLSTVLSGMVAACSTGGTAYPFFPRNAALADPSLSLAENLENGVMACKTGTAEFGAANEQGYRPTHGWFVSVVSPKLSGLAESGEQGADQISEQSADEQAAGQETTTSLAALDITDKNALYQTWLSRVTVAGFPSKLVLVAMVESDEENLYKEGSRDAAPVILDILKWIEGGEIAAEIPVIEQIGD